MTISANYDVIFDFDGVIGDSAPLIMEILASVLDRELRIVVAEDDLRAMVGPPLHHAVPALCASIGTDISPAGLDEVIASFRREYGARAPHDTPMFPGVHECLLALSGTVRLSICSSKPIRLLEAILQAWGAAHWFVDTEAPGLDQAEPKAVGLGRLLARLDANADRAVLVGDTVFDAAAASAHELPFIGVAWGVGDPADLTAAGAVAIAADPCDLPNLIGELRR